jgi:hypothetical protein
MASAALMVRGRGGGPLENPERIGFRSRTSIATSETWPSADEFHDLRPVAGAKVPSRRTRQSEDGVQFVFALHFPTLGEYETTGIEVRYTAPRPGSTSKETEPHAECNETSAIRTFRCVCLAD